MACIMYPNPNPGGWDMSRIQRIVRNIAFFFVGIMNLGIIAFFLSSPGSVRSDCGGLGADFALQLAKSPFAPSECLRQLALHEDTGVRLEVAEHASTPPDALENLATDKNRLVRWGVAMNDHTPREYLVRLSMDDEISVRNAANFTIRYMDGTFGQ